MKTSPATPAPFWCANLPESHIETERPSVTAIGCAPLAVLAALRSGSGALTASALHLQDARADALAFIEPGQQNIGAHGAHRSGRGLLDQGANVLNPPGRDALA